MKVLAFAAVAAFGFAQAQKLSSPPAEQYVPKTLPKLSAAQAVDIRVKTIQWHPSGEALLYSREEESGIGIGTYRLANREGKVVLHLHSEDKWRAEWFPGSACALVFVNRKVRAGWGEAKESAVYLLDAAQKSSYEVFARVVRPEETLEVDADLSPSLTHAIFDVREGKARYHVVLPAGGGTLVASPDIDQALSQGFWGPGWSANGTATYTKGSAKVADLLQVEFTLAAATDAIKRANDSTDSWVQTKANYDRTFSAYLRSRAATPAAGTPVLEVVPSNGALRQVLSPGPWLWPKPAPQAVFPVSHPVWIEFEHSRSNSNSLWLSDRPKSSRTPNDPSADGVLVAAHADWADLSPEDKAIAYLIDGALFVRVFERR